MDGDCDGDGRARARALPSLSGVRRLAKCTQLAYNAAPPNPSR